MKPIISNFYAGWLLFQVDSYSCCASYLNSTPTDLLDAFITYFKTGKPQVIILDCEDKGEIYVIIDLFVSVVDKKLEYFNYNDNVSSRLLAIQLLSDITSHYEEIIYDFYFHHDKNEKRRLRTELKSKCSLLSKLLEKERRKR